MPAAPAVWGGRGWRLGWFCGCCDGVHVSGMIDEHFKGKMAVMWQEMRYVTGVSPGLPAENPVLCLCKLWDTVNEWKIFS